MIIINSSYVLIATIPFCKTQNGWKNRPTGCSIKYIILSMCGNLLPFDGWLMAADYFYMGRIDPVEYVEVSQQRNGNVRNIIHPLCGCATLVIQKITFPL